MMKNHFTNALKGILIGLILSILFSFLYSPSTYMPLSPSSAVGFLPLATLGGWFPFQISFYISVIIEFSLVYLIVWAVSYYLNKKKVDEINRQLQGKA